MKRFPVEKVILVLAASFAAYNFGLAGGYIESRPFSIGGFIAGVVVNVSLAIAASRYGSIKGDKRTRQAQIAFFIMLLLSPLLVSPVIYYRLPDTFLTPELRVAWSVGWPLVADLAIVLAGAVSGKGLIALDEQPSVSKATTKATAKAARAAHERETAEEVRRTQAAVRTQCAALSAQYACKEPDCGWSPDVERLMKAVQEGRDPKPAAASAKAGHVKNQHKPIPLDRSLLIPNEKEKR